MGVCIYIHICILRWDHWETERPVGYPIYFCFYFSTFPWLLCTYQITSFYFIFVQNKSHLQINIINWISCTAIGKMSIQIFNNTKDVLATDSTNHYHKHQGTIDTFFSTHASIWKYLKFFHLNTQTRQVTVFYIAWWQGNQTWVLFWICSIILSQVFQSIAAHLSF